MFEKTKQFLKDKKGIAISDLAPLAVVFVILAIVIGMGAMILDEMNDSGSVTSDTAHSVLTDGISALSDFSGWFGILVLIVIAAIIIGIVMRYFGGVERSGI